MLLAIVLRWAPMWLAATDGLDPEQQAEDIGRARTALLAALAGSVAVVGAYYTSRTYALGRAGQITDRYTRAIDQLGHNTFDVRTGSIYALERLAKESPADRDPIMDILAAYVRGHAPIRGEGVAADDDRQGEVRLNSDVQAALDVLVSPERARPKSSVPDLKSTDLRGAVLRGARLSDADLRDTRLSFADLADADLRKARLSQARLDRVVNLETANLSGATYDEETKWPTDFDPMEKGALKIGVPRRLVVCCDGVWGRTPQDSPFNPYRTNVANLHEGIARADSNGVQQIPFYDPGRGGSRQSGLSRSILECYQFLIKNYEPGDEIFLFGFSRGAYTARSLASLVGLAGILRRRHIERAAQAYGLYRDRRVGPRDLAAKDFRKKYSWPEVTIRFIGVWDTAGALGIPWSGIPLADRFNRRSSFHDIRLGSHVEAAFQALAIDETRRPFQPCLWEQRPGAVGQTLEQVWFSGGHKDVGGGYRDSGASKPPLRWMVDRAGRSGLAFKAQYGVLNPDAQEPGQLNDRTGFYRLLPPTHRVMGFSFNGHESVSSSAVARLSTDPDYRPANLEEYLSGPHAETPV